MTVAEALKQSKAMTFMQKSSIEAAQDMLIPGEDILWATCCSIHKSPVRGELSTDGKLVNTDRIAGVVVVTERRIFFVNRSMGFSFSKEMRLSAIQSVDAKADSGFKMLRFEILRIVGESDMIVALSNPQTMRGLRNAINKALAERDAAKELPYRQDSEDDQLQASDIEQLQALKQLYDSGVLTEEEFSAKKAQILNL